MANDVPLRIGLKIDVGKGDGTKLYKSSIQNLQENSISIAMPYSKEHPLVLRRNDEIQVQFIADDNCYLFTTNVLGETRDNIVIYRVAYPQEIHRIQQRMHFSIAVSFPVQYAPLVETDAKQKTPLTFKNATAVDISGGGIRIAVGEQLKENQLLYVKFTLPMLKEPLPMQLKGRVMRSFLKDEKTRIYHTGVRFEDLKYQQEDKIVRYTFEKMAQQKRLL